MTLDPVAAARAVARGNERFAAGDYAGAVRAYEEATAAGAGSADVQFNLGAAWYRAGDAGKAALAWERALRQDPGDEGARQALETVRAASVDRSLAGEDPFVVRLGSRTDPDLAAAGLLVLWTLGFAVLAARRRIARPFLRAVAVAAAALLLGGSLLAGGAAWATLDVRRSGQAVVLVETAVREAPDDGAPESFAVHPGLRVRVEPASGGHVRVILPSGLAGFVPSAAVEKIDVGPGDG